MRKLLCVISLCILFLTGCSEEQEFTTGELVPLEIPVSDTEVLTINFPSSLQLVETDNNVYWEFDQDVNVYVMSSTSKGTSSKTGYENVYHTKATVSKILDSCSIVIECPNYMNSSFVDILGKTKISTNDVVLEQDYRLESLPTYNNVEMLLDEHNFYMPVSSVENKRTLYVSAIANNGTDWLECWTKDCDVITLELQMLTLVVNNTDADYVSWYKDDTIMYMEYGNNICAAKRLSYNQWYIYYGSLAYKDYIMQGLDLIHRSE